MLQGGPPTAVRVDGRAFSGIGEVLFAQPNLETPVAIKVDWHLEGMPKGAQAVTSFGDGDIDLPVGAPDRLDNAVYMVGPVWREPEQGTIDNFSAVWADDPGRSEEHTSELQSLMRISYAVFCLNKKQQ